MIVGLTSHRSSDNCLPEPSKPDHRAEELIAWFENESLNVTLTANQIGDMFHVKLFVWDGVTGIHLCKVKDEFSDKQMRQTKWKGKLLHKAYSMLFDIHSR